MFYKIGFVNFVKSTDMLIIGITGGSGSGKTTIVKQIAKTLPSEEVTVISQDSYYKSTSHLTMEEKKKINFDHPNAIDFDLLEQHLQELKKGNAIHKPIYDFAKHDRTEKTVLKFPRKILFVEGILIMFSKKIRDLLDFKIFVHATSDEKLIRRIKRDIKERKRDIYQVLNAYETHIKPMYKLFIAPTKEYADIIVNNHTLDNVSVDVIKTMIMKKLKV